MKNNPFATTLYTGTGQSLTIQDGLGWSPSFVMVKGASGDWETTEINYFKSVKWIDELIVRLDSVVAQNKDFMDWCFEYNVSHLEAPDSMRRYYHFKFPNNETKTMFVLKWQ